jgi:hypothetical protein
MKWNDAEIYFASEATTSERHWEMEKDDSGKYALIREEKLIGVFDNTASAIEEGHRRFGSNFLIKQLDENGNEVFLEVLPAFPDEDAGE